MYLIMRDGSFQLKTHLEKERQAGQEIISICSYEDMEKRAQAWGLSLDVLEDARDFGYVKYDSMEGFDCMSLELPDFCNVGLSYGSLVIYLEKERAFFFTSQEERVQTLLEKNAKALGERVSLSRMLYAFCEGQTKEDHIAFDAIEKEIMELEQALITTHHHNCVGEIISLRKRLMFLKRYYEQLLNALELLVQNENEIFEGKTLRAFKMLARRTERRFQSIVDLRDCVTQVRESYEAEVDINLNTTMKVFTVVTTIFLPLTLIVGWYGMNFDMPEYGWRYGYPLVILVSLVFIAAGIFFFKKNKWF